MRKHLVPVVLSLVSAHGEHFGHGVVDALDTAIGAGVVRAGVDLAGVKAFVDGVGEVRGKVQPGRR